MHTADQIDPDKLRGGFYSPPALVAVCLDRIACLCRGRDRLRILEPSAGDGAFIRGLAAHPLARRIDSVTAIEIAPNEARKCRSALKSSGLAGQILNRSALREPQSRFSRFDAAVGNPPFLRFQFIADSDTQDVVRLGDQLGVDFSSVGNLWMPVLMSAIASVRDGGAFAFIIPTESLTGVSAAAFRRWILRNSDQVQIDLFEPGSFPGVLQEILVLSGRRIQRDDAKPSSIVVLDHQMGYTSRWQHTIDDADETWSTLLIDPKFYDLRFRAREFKDVATLGDVARFSVSTVTGANKFFSVSDEVSRQFDLAAWQVALLPRIREAKGLEFTTDDHEQMADTGVARWLLDFSSDKPNPRRFKKPRSYIAAGETKGLHTRHKTSIRTPWYRVPIVRPKSLLMSKRSHHYPRIVVNQAEVLTTDTIYQAAVSPEFGDERAVAACFHNSLTLLTAELEGRSLGGGVLELVPSQVARLLLPFNAEMSNHFQFLDALLRKREPDPHKLVKETDQLLSGLLPRGFRALLEEAGEARSLLMERRLARSASRDGEEDGAI